MALGEMHDRNWRFWPLGDVGIVRLDLGQVLGVPLRVVWYNDRCMTCDRWQWRE